MARTEFGNHAIDDRQTDASLLARSLLMDRLAALIRNQGWTQKQAASHLGVTQPRVSDLMRSKIDLFSLDTLVDMSELAGLKPHIVVQGDRIVTPDTEMTS